MARTLTDTATIEWDEATSGQEKAHIVAGSIQDSHIHSSAAIAQSKIASLVSDLAAKAPLANPTFTGTPAAPTASVGTNTTQIATTAYVRTEIAALVASLDVMVFKGVIDCSSNPNYPAADAGHTYRVSVAGKIGGGSGVNVEAGDILLCLADSTASGNHATVGTSWSIIQVNVDGAVSSASNVGDAGLGVFYQKTGLDLEFRKIDFAAPLEANYAELPNKNIEVTFDNSADLDNNARVGVRKNSTGSTHERRRLNFIEGSNVTITIADDSGSEEVDVTIAASGGGGGSPGGSGSELQYRVDASTFGAVSGSSVSGGDVAMTGQLNLNSGSYLLMNGQSIVKADGAGSIFFGSGAANNDFRFHSLSGGLMLMLEAANGFATFMGGARFTGYTTAAADPSTTQVPNNKDFCLHKNSSSGSVFLAYNDSGAVKKVALT